MKFLKNNTLQKIIYGLIIFFGILTSFKLGSLTFTVKNINNVENMYIDSGIIEILLRDINFLKVMIIIMFIITIVSYHTFINSINDKDFNNN